LAIFKDINKRNELKSLIRKKIQINKKRKKDSYNQINEDLQSYRSKVNKRDTLSKFDNRSLNENDIVLKNIKERASSTSNEKSKKNIISDIKDNKHIKVQEEFNTFVKNFLMV